MNKKLKKYLFLVPTISFILFLALLSYVSFEVIICGKHQININNNKGDVIDFAINAKGVFGSETKIYSRHGIANLEGYYKKLEIESDNLPLNRIVDIVFIEEKSPMKSNIVFVKALDSQKIIIEENINIKKGFIKRTIDILSFELSRPVFKDLLFFSVIIVLIVLMFFLIRRERKKDEIESSNLWHRLTKDIGVFFIGSIFWILTIILVLEIALRIVGIIYSEKHTYVKVENTDDKFVVLCIGDSFTYGVGSTKNHDYPSQLQSLLQEKMEQEVIVINRGRCAQNTAQVIEKLQDDLNFCKPDLVVMLFGMANSWNYYGYHSADNFWERIRVVKLYKRIRYNIKYKGASTDTEQNVNKYAESFLIKSNNYPAVGENSFYKYYFKGRYYLAKRDWENSFKYLSFALSLNQFDIECFNAIKKCVQEYDKGIFEDYYDGVVDKTIVYETLQILDSFISTYPQAEVFEYLKTLYLFEKGSTDIDYQKLEFRRKQISKDFDFKIVHDVEMSFNNNFDSLYNFYVKSRNVENAEQINVCLLWLDISDKRFADAAITLDSMPIPSDKLSLELFSLAQVLTNLSIDNLTDCSSIENEKIRNILQSSYLEMLNKSENSIDFKSGIHQLFAYYVSTKTEQDQMYFLPHRLKRTANIEQSKIFDWIKNDIETAIEICLKQNYPVVCMNYPIIPPPNSDEISYWADSVGRIWHYTADKYHLPFVNNDSIFKTYGENQNEYFEPHNIGSEHCSNKGYRLMSKNIRRVIFENKISDN